MFIKGMATTGLLAYLSWNLLFPLIMSISQYIVIALGKKDKIDVPKEKEKIEPNIIGEILFISMFLPFILLNKTAQYVEENSEWNTVYKFTYSIKDLNKLFKSD